MLIICGAASSQCETCDGCSLASSYLVFSKLHKVVQHFFTQKAWGPSEHYVPGSYLNPTSSLGAIVLENARIPSGIQIATLIDRETKHLTHAISVHVIGLKNCVITDISVLKGYGIWLSDNVYWI